MKTLLTATAMIAAMSSPMWAEAHLSADVTAETETEAQVGDMDLAADIESGVEAGVDATADTMIAAGDEVEGAVDGMVTTDAEATMMAEMTAGDWTGLNVYGSGGELIGEVDELIISADGSVTKAIIDVGGFLGLGEKPVALDFAELTLKSEADGEANITDEHYIFIAMTEAQLEAMPTYEADM